MISKEQTIQGKEISRFVQNKWDKNFSNNIKVVVGDEWYAGNLSYHLNSRPKWFETLEDNLKLLILKQELFILVTQKF